MRQPDHTHTITCYFRAAEGIGLLILGAVSLVLIVYLKK
jgi:hypothetical protein